MSSDYQNYLRSDHWQDVRRLVRQRSKGACERCHLDRAQAVHHLTYRYRGEEHLHLETVQHVCGDCHRYLHGRSQYDPKQITGPNGLDMLRVKMKEMWGG